MVSSHGTTEESTKATMRTIRNADMESSNGLMAESTMDNGKMENNMEKDTT